LADFVKNARLEIKRAGLSMEEVIGLRLYTGPLFVLYNAVLRGFPEKDVILLMGNKYETSIFTITSAITKLSKITKIPFDRLLYRGLGGMILPRQFWDTYAECIVEVRIHAVEMGMGESAESNESVQSVLAAVKVLLRKATDQPAGSAKGKVFDISVELVQLPANSVPESLREATASGIRVVREPQAAGEFVSMSLALPVTKFRFEEELQKDFVKALGEACGKHVDIVSVADKPQSFRGGVEYGLMSTTTDKQTAFAYSGVTNQRGTVLEIAAGRIDVGASISFVSQYPGEAEFLMPPLSCLEVVGGQRIDRTAHGEVVVVPVRVNVNLKTITVEELTDRRKLQHTSMAKNLREELLYALEAQFTTLAEALAGRRAGRLELMSGDASEADLQG
jgi:hypothetical protein